MERFSFRKIYVLFIGLAGASVSEALGERVMINLELSDLLVLVGGHCYEGALLQGSMSWNPWNSVCPFPTLKT